MTMVLGLTVKVPDDRNDVAFGCLGKGNDQGCGCDVRGGGGGGGRVKTLTMINNISWWINQKNRMLKIQCYWPCNLYFSLHRKQSSKIQRKLIYCTL